MKKNNNYLLTIVTVCYNSEKTIRNCVESVIKQLNDNVEYIIIDGASKDNTLNILKEYDSNLKIYSERDTGIYNAMNKGIDKANGKYILYMNSDDCLKEGVVDVILNAIKTDKDCYYGDTETHYMVGNDDYSRIEIGLEDFKLLPKNPLYYHQSFWCKKDKMIEVGKFKENDYKIAADWELMFRLYNSGCTFEHVNYIISDYYFGGVSAKWHVWERHRVRKNNNSYKYFDKYLIRDFLKFSKNAILDFILGNDKHNYLIAKRKGFKKIDEKSKKNN